MANKTKINWKPHNPCEDCEDLSPCETCNIVKHYRYSKRIIRDILKYLVESSDEDTVSVAKLKSMLNEIRGE